MSSADLNAKLPLAPAGQVWSVQPGTRRRSQSWGVSLEAVVTLRDTATSLVIASETVSIGEDMTLAEAIDRISISAINILPANNRALDLTPLTGDYQGAIS